MPWATSDRRSRLPRDWSARVARIRIRDRGVCQWSDDNGGICGAQGRDVDHIIPGDDHADANLWLLCGPHHDAKTAAEASEARWRHKRRPEPHPGIIP